MEMSEDLRQKIAMSFGIGKHGKLRDRSDYSDEILENPNMRRMLGMPIRKEAKPLPPKKGKTDWEVAAMMAPKVVRPKPGTEAPLPPFESHWPGFNAWLEQKEKCK